jgi:hypothetical protein
MNEHIAEFTDLRKKLHSSIPYRADAIIDLIDALSANTQAKSVAELSLDPLFRRKYTSLYDAVDNFFVASRPEKAKQERDAHQKSLMHIVAPLCPRPTKRNFYLFALDATSQPRQFANTLQDRGFVYKPNPIAKNKPVTIGHSYSILVAMPEKKGNNVPPWVLPLSSRRVPTDEKATDIGAAQVEALLEDKGLPFGQELTVLVADSAYSAVTFLGRQTTHKNQVTIVRVRGNRTFYRTPIQDSTITARPKGHPTWYGRAFNAQDPSTWHPSDETASTTYTTKKGRLCQVEIQAWHNMLMNGKKDIPMHQHPFTLIRITVTDDNGKAVYRRPMWIIVIGERRYEISVLEAYNAYGQRFDIEHFFRFGKNKLLMDDYQTSDVEHEENWWEIVSLSYIQLWSAARIAQTCLRPWERYLPIVQDKKTDLSSPSMVQRDMKRIIAQAGTSAKPPKPRGKSPGRQKGYSPGRRNRCPVIKKSVLRQPKVAHAP